MLCPCSRCSGDMGSDGLCRGLGDHGLSSQLLGAGHRCPSWVSRWPDPGLVPYGPPQFLGGPTGQVACNQQHRFIWADCSGDLPADPRRLQPLLQLLLCGCWALRCPHILAPPSDGDIEDTKRKEHSSPTAAAPAVMFPVLDLGHGTEDGCPALPCPGGGLACEITPWRDGESQANQFL